MQHSFPLYIRQHVNNWLTVSVLGHPAYTVFGPSLQVLKNELHAVLAQEMATGALSPGGNTWHDDMERRVLELELRAVQHDRLILVPMRFTMLVRPVPRLGKDLHEVHLPRLKKTFRIVGTDNIKPWAEELIRGHFHLESVDTLLRYQYERGERVERFDVTWHGKGGKKAKQQRQENTDLDVFAHLLQTPLSQVGVELVEEARQARIPRAYFRDEDLRQLLGILDGAGHSSTLLVGPSGVGKTALVYELAHRIALGQVPLRLQEVPLWHVTGGRIIAGMKFLGQWQERCLQIVEEIRNERGILYVDNILELMMAGSSSRGMNVATFLLPYIQSGEITVLGEASPDSLLLAEQHGASFVQALRRMPLRPFDAEQAYNILEVSAGRLEKEHKVVFSAPALSRALDVLARFGDADALPGSGLALIEQMARLPQAKLIQAATRNAGDTAGTLIKDKTGRPILQAHDAIAAFSRASGFPENLIDPDQLLQVAQVEEFFQSRVMGQDDATELLTNLIMVIKSSLNDPSRPLGSFLFMGPTGVGKTESALTLAEYLFGDRERLVRFDMSEYGYPGSAARMVGGPRGEGDLTRRVREQPFSVLLFDEVEKADPEVFDVLLQVLGEGRLTDGTGRTVRFGHTIIIMTSNLGAGADKRIGLKGHQANKERELAHHYREAARAYFRPEFINRLDFLVPFSDLGQEAVRLIAKRMLDKALAREGFSRRGITVTYQDDLLDLLMKHGFDPRYGARPMKRAVEQRVLIPLSRRLILRAAQTQETFSLYVDQGAVAVVSDRGLSQKLAPRFSGLALEHDHLWSRTAIQLRARIQEWDQSALLAQLRGQDQRDLSDRLQEALARLTQLEALAPGGPSAQTEPQRADLTERAATFDQYTRRLEWDLCLASAPDPGDDITLELEAPSLHPQAASAARTMAQSYSLWAQTHDLRCTQTRDGALLHLRIQGPHAATLLRHELGLHKLITEHDEIELMVSAQGHPPQRTLVREVSADPDTLWDPTTEIEVAAPLGDLHQHLDALLLARLATKT